MMSCLFIRIFAGLEDQGRALPAITLSATFLIISVLG